jgi:hypothetical protein
LNALFNFSMFSFKTSRKRCPLTPFDLVIVVTGPSRHFRPGRFLANTDGAGADFAL